MANIKSQSATITAAIPEAVAVEAIGKLIECFAEYAEVCEKEKTERARISEREETIRYEISGTFHTISQLISANREEVLGAIELERDKMRRIEDQADRALDQALQGDSTERIQQVMDWIGRMHEISSLAVNKLISDNSALRLNQVKAIAGHRND